MFGSGGNGLSGPSSNSTGGVDLDTASNLAGILPAAAMMGQMMMQQQNPGVNTNPSNVGPLSYQHPSFNHLINQSFNQ